MISLDEKDLKKEQKNHSRQEKKNKIRKKKMDDNEKSMKNKIKGKGLSYETKKIIIISVPVLLLIISIIIFRKPLLEYVDNIGRNDTSENYVLLSDITGFNENDAINELKELGFYNIQKEYIIDKFTEDKCVIKTNYHINSLLKPDDEIIIYICDKSLIEEFNNIEETETNKNINTTYFSMNNLSIIDSSVENNKFHFIVKNNNKQAITKISYKIGYEDKDKNTIGENKYKLDENKIILSGEKFEIVEEIDNDNAYYIYVSGFSYDKIDTPENERK